MAFKMNGWSAFTKNEFSTKREEALTKAWDEVNTTQYPDAYKEVLKKRTQLAGLNVSLTPRDLKEENSEKND